MPRWISCVPTSLFMVVKVFAVASVVGAGLMWGAIVVARLLGITVVVGVE